MLNQSLVHADVGFICRRCRGRSARIVVSNVPDRLHRLHGEFSYVRCQSCHLLQLSQTPPDLWRRHYSAYRRHSEESSFYRAGRRLVTGHCYVRPEATGRLLDLGCGNGAYLAEMARGGWEPVGYEPDRAHAKAVSQKTGIRIVSTESELRDGYWDLVTLNFSLEHAEDPTALLRLASRCCKSGGRVVVSLPDPESREARLFGEYWFHLDAPRHLILLTRTQASSLLEEVGLEVQTVTDLPAATGFAGSLCYRIVGGFNAALWYSLIPLGIVFAKLVPDGLFLVSAKKPA